MRKHILVVMAAILVLALAAAAMAADDPFFGVWKVNLEKSKYAPGYAPKSETITVVALKNGMFEESIDGVDASGKPYHKGCTARYDGKTHSIPNDPNADAVTFRKIKQDTIEYSVTKGGKEIESGRAVLSNGGNTMTSTDKDTDANGKTVTSVIVREKQ
jgi:hypothetical protein